MNRHCDTVPPGRPYPWRFREICGQQSCDGPGPLRGPDRHIRAANLYRLARTPGRARGGGRPSSGR